MSFKQETTRLTIITGGSVELSERATERRRRGRIDRQAAPATSGVVRDASIYLINLDYSADRLAAFQKRNAHLRDVIQFPASDGRLLDRDELVKRGSDLARIASTLPVRWGALSRIYAYRRKQLTRTGSLRSSKTTQLQPIEFKRRQPNSCRRCPKIGISFNGDTFSIRFSSGWISDSQMPTCASTISA